MTQMINDSFYRSALASKISYIKHCNNPNNLKRLQHLQGANVCNIIDKTNTGAHMYVYDCGTDAHMIAFRGTVSLKHMMRYCDTSMTTFSIRNKKIKVHSHILQLFQSLENDLSNIICESLELQKNKTITFCGHSAGGSIAQFAAAYYGDITNNNIKINCHTLGSPKVGDTEFINWYNENVTGESIQVVHQNDWVKMLPFDNRYTSHKDLIILNSGGHWTNPMLTHDIDTYINTVNNMLHMTKSPVHTSSDLS